MAKFAPIYKKDEQRFLVEANNFTAETEQKAWEIGVGSKLVECIIWKCDFTGKVMDVEQAVKEKQAGRKAEIVGGTMSIPIFVLDK